MGKLLEQITETTLRNCSHPITLRRYFISPDSYSWMGKCDACGEQWYTMAPVEKVIELPMIEEPAKVEGNIMDVTQRIKYNDKQGHWEVLFNGKVMTKTFKTAGDAYQYLADLKSGKEKA